MQLRPDPSLAQRLTTWPNEPSLLTLKTDFEMAKPAHDSQMLKIKHWAALMAAKGPAKVKNRSSVQPKLIRRQAEWRYAALTEPFLGSSKIFGVSPVSWEDEEAARQNKLVLNWQFRTKLNRVKFIDDYVRSTVDEGTCVLRVGWCRNTVKVKQKVPVYSHFNLDGDEQLQPFQQALALRDENPRQYEETVPPALKAAIDFYDESGQATFAVESHKEEVLVDKVVENKPTLEILNPQNFYLDPTCNGDVSKALFAIVSFETNQAELKKYPERYKNLEFVNWETSTPLTEPDHATQINETAQFRDVLRKRVVAYEYWGFYDVAGDGVLVPIVCTWIGDTLIRMEKNPFPDQKLPFVIVPYLPVKREAFGEPDAELLEDNQAILGAVTRGMIDLMGRSANAQRGMAKGALDPLNKRKYEAGEDYEFNPNANPTSQIIEHKFPELPQSALQMVNLQNAEAEALTGVKSFSGGMSGEAYGDVAAGIKGVLDAAAKREMAILRRLAQGMVEVGQKLISMNAAFLSKKEVIRVTNAEFVQLSPAQQETGADAPTTYEDGVETKNKFITINRDDLAGSFDLEVDISTAEVDNAKAQDLAFMVQTIGPNAGPELAMMLMSEIAELKRMPALAHRLKNFKPQPDPMAERLKQLEVEKAQAEVDELKSRAELNRAKMGEALATKDLKDLQYVETETGTAHARELDKQTAQSRGNANLAVTKALLTPKKPEEKSPDIEAAVGFNRLNEEEDHLNTVGRPPLRVDTLPATQPIQAEPQF